MKQHFYSTAIIFILTFLVIQGCKKEDPASPYTGSNTGTTTTKQDTSLWCFGTWTFDSLHNTKMFVSFSVTTIIEADTNFNDTYDSVIVNFFSAELGVDTTYVKTYYEDGQLTSSETEVISYIDAEIDGRQGHIIRNDIEYAFEALDSNILFLSRETIISDTLGNYKSIIEKEYYSNKRYNY